MPGNTQGLHSASSPSIPRPTSAGPWTAAAAPEIQAVPLTELAPVSEQQGYGSPGLDRNRPGAGSGIHAGRSFEHGLATHAASRIVYALGGKGARFTAFVGVDAAMSGYRESV
ncbi:MAG: NPCBM/NEW2 domain-containing protein [Kiritimatiellia bacterium]